MASFTDSRDRATVGGRSQSQLDQSLANMQGLQTLAGLLASQQGQGRASGGGIDESLLVKDADGIAKLIMLLAQTKNFANMPGGMAGTPDYGLAGLSQLQGMGMEGARADLAAKKAKAEAEVSAVNQARNAGRSGTSSMGLIPPSGQRFDLRNKQYMDELKRKTDTKKAQAESQTVDLNLQALQDQLAFARSEDARRQAEEQRKQDRLNLIKTVMKNMGFL